MRNTEKFYEIEFNSVIIQAVIAQNFPNLTATVSHRQPTKTVKAAVVITATQGGMSLADLMGQIRPFARDFGCSDADVSLIIDATGFHIAIPVESEVPSISRVTKEYVVEDLPE